jgi:hypothetical protein
MLAVPRRLKMEWYELRIIRLDERDEWDDVPLPYQQVRDNLSVKMAE